jgi:hypothetical protein
MWFKITSGEALVLSDMPELIRLRWPYFRDNWETLKQTYTSALNQYPDAESLRANIDSFSEFIKIQRNAKNTANPFDNDDVIARFYAIFDNTRIDTVSLTFEEQQILNNKIKNIEVFTRKDFIDIRTQLEKERDELADKTSSTDDDYNRVFGRSAQPARVDIKNKDINKMFELQEAIKATNFIIANAFTLDSSFVDPFALAKSNANNPEIDIQTYASGTLVKMNYGEDLQALAKRTLGDPDKWIDIAIANGLKAPYIDEVGEKIPLISNASENQVNIAETTTDGRLNIDKLSVGQVVLLQSTVENFPEQRIIQNIIQVPISGEIVIELEGEPNLDRYKISEDAHIRIFKLNTINSGFFVLIPSTSELSDDLKSETPWFLRGDDTVIKRQKVDLNLNKDGDINFNSTGDLQLSYGLDNSIQAIKLKMGVEAGELRRHPEFGLAVVQGLKNNNLAQVRKILSDSIVSSIESDERFGGINTLDVTKVETNDNFAASAIAITLVVRLAGSDVLVPITFTVAT